MKIRQFTGVSVNGYLNFNIRFHSQLSFLTGINGSGKTSALNCMAAMLLPRLDYLASIFFDEISITISHEKKTVKLSATKANGTTEIQCSNYTEEKLIKPEIDEIDSVRMRNSTEFLEEFYRDIRAQNANNAILNFIYSLPTPMYLGLDRRSLTFGGDRLRYERGSASRRQLRRNIFGRTLEQGLSEALDFARDQYQRDRRSERMLDERFRQKLVLALIEIPPVSFSGTLEEPDFQDLQEFRSARTNLRRLAGL